jgi:hypothetical protein
METDDGLSGEEGTLPFARSGWSPPGEIGELDCARSQREEASREPVQLYAEEAITAQRAGTWAISRKPLTPGPDQRGDARIHAELRQTNWREHHHPNRKFSPRERVGERGSRSTQHL